MSKNNAVKLTGRDTLADPLTELLRTGAERLIYQAVEAELQELLSEHAERRTEDGRAVVVRNGYLPTRKLQTGLGRVTVEIPKVRAKTARGDVPLSPGAAPARHRLIRLSFGGQFTERFGRNPAA